MFRLADRLGKSLNELMGWKGPMTWRQYKAWLAWIDLDLDQPSRSDQYLMQLTCVVQRLMAQNPEQIRMSDFKLKFVTEVPSPTDEGNSEYLDTSSMEEQIYRSQVAWCNAVGARPPDMPESLRAKFEEGEEGDDG